MSIDYIIIGAALVLTIWQKNPLWMLLLFLTFVI